MLSLYHGYNNVKPNSLVGNPDHVKMSSIMAVYGMLRCFLNQFVFIVCLGKDFFLLHMTSLLSPP